MAIIIIIIIFAHRSWIVIAFRLHIFSLSLLYLMRSFFWSLFLSTLVNVWACICVRVHTHIHTEREKRNSCIRFVCHIQLSGTTELVHATDIKLQIDILWPFGKLCVLHSIEMRMERVRIISILPKQSPFLMIISATRKCSHFGLRGKQTSSSENMNGDLIGYSLSVDSKSFSIERMLIIYTYIRVFMSLCVRAKLSVRCNFTHSNYVLCFALLWIQFQFDYVADMLSMRQ